MPVIDGAGVLLSWRRARPGARPGWTVVAALLLLAARAGAAEIVSPHNTDTPKVCLNCHTEEIYAKICDEIEGYCLLAGSVDGLCLTCHIKEECCKPGLQHLPKLHIGLRNHPTDVRTREIPPAYLPRTLPIHNGRVTCRTCHLHKRESVGGYKMLRLVRITERGVDWDSLCQDCHKDR